MKREQIERILEGVSGIRKEGSAFLLPEDSEVSFHIALPAELVSVSRVTRVEYQGDLTCLETHAGDRYFFATEFVAIIKNALPSKRNRVPAPGFR